MARTQISIIMSKNARYNVVIRHLFYHVFGKRTTFVSRADTETTDDT